MDIMEAIKTRRSIRAYKLDAVSKEIMDELLHTAIKAPSGSNTQPWKFYVVAGERKQQLDNLLLQCLDEGRETSNELQQFREGGNEAVQESMSSRRQELTKAIFDTLRDNDLPIEVFVKGSFKYFDAPVSVFITMDQSQAEGALLSIGAAVENLMLAACAKGLGTCWIGMALMYSKEIKQSLSIPNTERIVSSFCLGYPDLESPLSTFKATREDLKSVVEWIGWE